MSAQNLEINIKANTSGKNEVDALIDRLAKAGVDIAPFREEASKLDAEFKQLAQQQGLIDAFKSQKVATEATKDAMEAAQQKAQELAKSLKATEAANKDAKASFDAAKAAVQGFAEPLAEAKAKVATLEESFAKSKSVTQELKDQLALTRVEIKNLSAPSEDVTNRFNQLSAELKAAETATKAEKDALAAAKTEVKNLSNEMAAAQTNVKNAATALKAGETAAKEQSTAFAAARTAVKETSAEYQASVVKLQDLRQGLSSAGISTKDLSSAQTTLKREINNSASELSALKAKVQDAASSLQTASEKSKTTEKAMGDLAGQVKTLAAGFTFTELVKAMAQMEGLASGLQAVTGDSKLAAEQLEFVRKAAVNSGLDIVDATKAFLSLSASTKGTAAEGKMTQDVFVAVSSSMAKAGKSSAETSLALQALAQMASKGNVQMEELRGQLGEALPGALNAAAKGMGMTTKDLIALTESGQLLASDLFPALSKGLNELYGTAPAAQTLSQEFANIKNQFVELAANVGKDGGLAVLKVGAEIAQAAMVGLDMTIGSLGKGIGVLAAAAMTGDFSHLPEAFANIEKEASDKLIKAAQHNTLLAASIEKTGSESEKTALKAAQATDAMEKSANGAVSGYSALAMAYSKVDKELQSNVDTTKKQVAARDEEAKVIKQLGDIYGNEIEKMQASANAARVKQQAIDSLLEQETIQLNVLKQELKAKTEWLESEGAISEERKKQLKELKDAIELKQADVDKTAARSVEAKNLAAQLSLETEKHKDNSARLIEYKEAAEKASQEVKRLLELKKQGVDVSAQLAEAETKAARATALYRDAQDDLVRKLQARQVAEKSNADIQVTTLNAQKTMLMAIADRQKAEGNVTGALQTQLEVKRIDIMLIQAKVTAMRAEADGNIQVAKAELAVLESSGKVDPVKRAQIKASIDLAEAKKLEASATEMGIDAIVREMNAMQAAALGADDYAGATNRAADAQNNLAGAAANAASAVAKGAGGGGKPSNADVNAEMSKMFSLPNFNSREDLEVWFAQSMEEAKNKDWTGWAFGSQQNQMQYLNEVYQKSLKNFDIADAAKKKVSVSNSGDKKPTSELPVAQAQSSTAQTLATTAPVQPQQSVASTPTPAIVPAKSTAALEQSADDWNKQHQAENAAAIKQWESENAKKQAAAKAIDDAEQKRRQDELKTQLEAYRNFEQQRAASTVQHVYTVNIPQAGVKFDVASQGDADAVIAAMKAGKLNSGY